MTTVRTSREIVIRRLLAKFLLAIQLVQCSVHCLATTTVYWPCANMCSSHGTCGAFGVCLCFDGFIGADCSLRTCPFGRAWSDHAIGNDIAHQPAECSNRGHCDRVRGECVCEVASGWGGNGAAAPIFEGPACERTKCERSCMNRGRCVSLKTLASMQDPGFIKKDKGCKAADICGKNLDNNDINCEIVHQDYSQCRKTFQYELPWESEMIQGCFCDNGYTGFDCSIRSCPIGDDPLTTNQLNEVQLIKCRATSGTFSLVFMGKTTQPIPASATAEQLKATLSKLTTFRRHSSGTTIGEKISVQFSGATTVCSNQETEVKITFLENFGDLSLILPDGTHLSHVDDVPQITSEKFVTGSKETDVCSNRGNCNSKTGVCLCVNERWTTSNGYNGPGNRGDCGYDSSYATTSCPRDCSGRGTCSGAPDYRCDCEEGSIGSDCSISTCPSGKSWFSFPSADNSGHELAVCSDKGVCNPDSGVCGCADGFEGAACQYMKCPGYPFPCSGNGICLPMSQLAAHSKDANGLHAQFSYGVAIPDDPLLWDFEIVRGCDCSDGYEGYDCSIKTCPSGDNPGTPHQFNEVQYFSCQLTADGGTFTLKFRDEVTIPLSVDDNVNDLKSALESLNALQRMKVYYTDNSIYVGARGLDSDALHLCHNTASGQHISIEFESPTGDAPLLLATKDTYMDAVITISEHTKGTKEFITCSGKGLCNAESGQCICFPGFASSDGQGNHGTINNCGYQSPYRMED